jgi:hypothetical protein
MNRHRDGFQGVRCRVVTSRGNGSGARVRIFGSRIGEAMKRKKMVLESLLPKPGACVIAIIWLGQKVGREQQGLEG